MNSNHPIFDRNKRSPSTFTVPQQPQPNKAATPQQPKSESPRATKPPAEIDVFLNMARRDSAKVDIELVNGKEYLRAIIKHVERYMLVIEHDGKEVGIMKIAIATVGR
jgi:sRNA-binding regulator protein Hfq